MEINNLNWHDGNITKFEMISNYGSGAQINIFAQIYDDSVRTPGRDPIKLQCINVTRFNCSCDLVELNDNSGAGSINDCSHKGNIIRFHLFGGFIEIEAAEINLEKC